MTEVVAGMDVGIKKRGSGGVARGCLGSTGKEEASLHLPTNFMRLVNSRKRLTDRLIHGLSNFII